MQQNITKYNRTLQNITEHYRTLQNITEHYRILQNITKYYRILQEAIIGYEQQRQNGYSKTQDWRYHGALRRRSRESRSHRAFVAQSGGVCGNNGKKW
jgi:hypothetical protein